VTAAVVGLAASQLTLVVLLLSLNFRSAWRWPVKAGAIALTLTFFVSGCLALEALLGWPVAAAPPARFELHAALVQEPDHRSHSAGAIYLWLLPRAGEAAPGATPRAYALPYSRPLHEQIARAQSRMQDGRTVEGSAKPGERPDRAGLRAYEIELYEAPPATLPPKTEERATSDARPTRESPS
jgi:hypothetical protein